MVRCNPCTMCSTSFFNSSEGFSSKKVVLIISLANDAKARSTCESDTYRLSWVFEDILYKKVTIVIPYSERKHYNLLVHTDIPWAMQIIFWPHLVIKLMNTWCCIGSSLRHLTGELLCNISINHALPWRDEYEQMGFSWKTTGFIFSQKQHNELHHERQNLGVNFIHIYVHRKKYNALTPDKRGQQ